MIPIAIRGLILTIITVWTISQSIYASRFSLIGLYHTTATALFTQAAPLSQAQSEDTIPGAGQPAGKPYATKKST